MILRLKWLSDVWDNCAGVFEEGVQLGYGGDDGEGVF